MRQSPILRNRPVFLKASRTSRSRFLLAATGAVLLVLLLLAVLSRNTEPYYDCQADAPTVFDVVMDAGSTGSRVHIFQFERRGTELVLEKEFFHRTKPGLSSFADRPDEAVASIKLLTDAAKSLVPTQYHKCTSVTLKATAGLRLLPHAKSQLILDRVQRHIDDHTPFSNRGVSIITGNEEGTYGWLTVNYLLGNLFSATEPSVAIMDMGGASTQIVFETDEEDGEWVPYNYVSRLRINDRRITLYHHSYLGFGLNEARRRVYTAVVASDTLSRAHAFPCFPAQFAVKIAPDATLKGSSAAGAQSFEACRRAIIGAMLPTLPSSPAPGESSAAASKACKFRRCGIASVPQPPLLHSDHRIFAFSYFFDRLQPFLPEDDAPVSVEMLKTVGTNICNSASHPQNRETMCLDFAYLYTYLHDGLHLSDSTPLSVQEKINGKSVSWSLGASLMHLLHADS